MQIFICMVVNIICSYNEIRYIPKVVKYYQSQGIHVHVADNRSTDGTWEWLNDNNVSCQQFDTDGCFDLVKQQKVRLRLIEKFPNAEWIIYGDADEFIVSKSPLLEIFDNIKQKNSEANLLRMPSLNLKNTGESLRKDPTQNYFYYEERKYSSEIIRVHKNLDGVRYGAELGSIAGDIITFADGGEVRDRVWSTRDVVYDVNDAVLLNYGATKTAKHRTDLLKRRQKAWDRDLLPKNFGSHLVRGKQTNWTWNKEDLVDIRTHELFDCINKNIINL